ncbi:MAG: hypothetical protein KAT15_14330, partial [Bacteroidales bacterium]|nr:hypothetical protein [Bacteroidales bacterium]
MNKLSFLLSVFLLLLLITGCTSVKRFKSAIYVSGDNSPVDIELFPTRLDPEETGSVNRNLWDLSASAQTQLIQILNERYPDNVQFISSLSNEYPGDDEFISGDFTRKDLKMVFCISKNRDYAALNDASGKFSPADRIEYLIFTLEIPEKYNLHFREWNRHETQYGEIEIADVSFSRSVDLSADAAAGDWGDAGVKGSISRRENQSVRSRFLKLNGSISDRMIRIEQEGTREIDLTGNVIADVSLEFSGFPEKITIPLFAGEGDEDSAPREVAALKFVDVLVPRMEEAPDTIRATLVLDYVYRYVQSGWKTYGEWDDRVEYYTGTIIKEVPLFTSRDYLPSFYNIGIDYPEKHALRIRTGTDKEYPLQFRNYQDAKRFYDWLMSLSDPASGDPIRIGKITYTCNMQ